MFKKIITYFLILAVVLPIFATIVPFGGGVKTAYAAEDGNEITDPCDFGVGRAMLGVVAQVVNIVSPPSSSMWNCVTYTVAHFLYGVVMQGAIIVAGWASSLFNLSIQFSLTGDVFDAGKNIMIRDGWAMVRDLFNLVFIFILLYAAISTILQYGNMDIKKILPGLIVAALLVNFSLMISKVVIDASHIFAWEFYNQIDSTAGGKYPELKNDINVNGDFQKKNLANVFLAGFNPQSVLTGKINTVKSIGKDGTEIVTETNDESQWQKVVARTLKKDEKFPSTIGRLILIILLETALALFSAFILFAGAAMFIFRIVLLWMVMIFSPIAFLGMILPSMGKYSKMWWDYLINQAFFAPAFLFMFMLSTKFINNDMIGGLLSIEKNGDMSLATGLDGGGITSILLHFSIVAILMGGSLYIAKQMGGKSAELGMAWAHKGKNMALSPGWMLNNRLSNNRLSRYLYGAGADKILEGKGRTSGVLRSIPGVGMGLRKLGSMKKADEDKAKKAAEKYAGGLSDAGLKSLKSDTKSKSFIKRFAYSGPEGAFPSSKKGYENIAIKKKAEDEKKTRITEEKNELNALKAVESAAEIAKEKTQKEIEEIALKIEKLETDLTTQNYNLAKAVNDGDKTGVILAESNIDIIKTEKMKKNAEKKIREDKIKTIEKQSVRKKELEDKEERRKETEGLQEAIKTSGSAGGGGGKGGGGGGGGKTTP